MDRNQETAKKLDAMDLSKEAQSIIANTGLEVVDDLFGDCESADDVEALIKDYFE